MTLTNDQKFEYASLASELEELAKLRNKIELLNGRMHRLAQTVTTEEMYRACDALNRITNELGYLRLPFPL